MNYLLFIVVSTGWLAAIFLANLFGARLLAQISTTSSNPKIINRVGTIVGILSVLPASYLAIVVGGTMGGSFSESVAGHFGVILDLALGVHLVTLIGILAPTLLAGYITRFAEKIMR